MTVNIPAETHPEQQNHFDNNTPNVNAVQATLPLGLGQFSQPHYTIKNDSSQAVSDVMCMQHFYDLMIFL